MPAPFEIIAAPFTLYVAPTGTAFPAIDAAPGVAWTKVGTSGDLNYTEDGVTVQHSQSVELWRALGSTGARKAFRTEEGLTISLTLADLSLEQYQLALNGNAITDTAAALNTAGVRKIGLSRGREVKQYALLVRGGESPYGEDFALQYEVPVAVESGEPEVVARKGEPAALALTFQALEDPNAASATERFGRLLAQDAIAL